MTDLKELQEKILNEGTAVNETVLKVDGFLNHQVDPVLMQKIGEDFANYFKDRGITKIKFSSLQNFLRGAEHIEERFE